ncbi:hypothetical protein D9M72_621820 [compost metagenome]
MGPNFDSAHDQFIGDLSVLAKPVRQEVDKAAHFGGQITAMRVNRIDASVSGDVVIEQGYQFTGLDIGLGNKVRYHGDTQSRSRRTQRGLWRVDLNRAADSHRGIGAIWFEIPDIVVEA